MFIRFTRDYQAGSGRMFLGGEVVDVDTRWGNQLIAAGAATLNATASNPVTLVTDPFTGGVTGIVGADGVRIDYARKARLPKTLALSRPVMASPPSATYGTTPTIASPILWTPIGDAGGGSSAYFSGGNFSYAKSGLPVVGGSASPKDNTVRFSSVNYGSAGNPTSNIDQISFNTYSTAIELVMYGYNSQFMVKINDQYISLSPQATGTNNAVNYYYIPFGSLDMRRIDVLINGNLNGIFAGVRTASTESVQPAPIRGSTLVLFGDSFVEGGNPTYGQVESYPVIMAEALGMDNFVSSGVGATGFLAAPGGKLTYRQRLSTDLTPFAASADYVFFQCSSFNDTGYTIQQLQDEWALTLAAAKAIAPNAAYGFVGPMSNGGPSKTTLACWQMHNAAKAFCAANGMLFISCLEQALLNGKTPYTTTLTTSPSAGATAFSVAGSLTPGEVYAFPDGTRFRCLTNSGLPPSAIVTESGIPTAQTAGATVTQVGQSLWSGTGSGGTGTGNSAQFVAADGTHPTTPGAKAIGLTLAGQFLTATLANTVT